MATEQDIIIIMIMISGGLFRAAYYGAIGSQATYDHER
jgi:hypothetical protein